jgi:hypothetical protein
MGVRQLFLIVQYLRYFSFILFSWVGQSFQRETEYNSAVRVCATSTYNAAWKSKVVTYIIGDFLDVRSGKQIVFYFRSFAIIIEVRVPADSVLLRLNQLLPRKRRLWENMGICCLVRLRSSQGIDPTRIIECYHGSPFSVKHRAMGSRNYNSQNSPQRNDK